LVGGFVLLFLLRAPTLSLLPLNTLSHLLYFFLFLPTHAHTHTLTGQHYSVEKKDQKVEMTPAGFKYAEQIVGEYLKRVKINI
jgi:hypothetical protein